MNGRPETLPGWDRLTHHGLLLDASRLQELGRLPIESLSDYTAQQLRLRAGATMNEAQSPSDASVDRTRFVTFVLEQVCGLDAATGAPSLPRSAGARRPANRSSRITCGKVSAAHGYPCSSTTANDSVLAGADAL